MKQKFLKIKESGLFMFAVILLCAVFGIAGADAMICADGAPAPEAGQADSGTNSGARVFDEPLSLAAMMEAEPKLTREAFHDKVVIIDSYNHVLESTLASKRIWDKKKKSAHIVNVPSISATPVRITLPAAYAVDEVIDVELDFGADAKKIKTCQVLVFPEIQGYKADGTTPDNHCFMAVVTNKAATGTTVTVNAINGVKEGAVDNTVPDIPANTIVLRGVQLGSEKQIRTGITGGVPTMKEFYIRKKILETEVTTWGMLTDKEVKWTDSDNLNFAINEQKNENDADFYLGFGKEMKSYPNVHNNFKDDLAYTKEGVWWMPGKEFDAGGTFDVNTIIDLLDEIFTENNGSPTRYAYIGRNVQKAFASLLFPTGAAVALGKIYEDEKLKIRYNSIVYMGGKELRLVHEPALDNIGMPDCAIIIDQDNAFQYNFGTPRVIELDHVKLGTSDSKGQVITDEEANVLVNSNTHLAFYLDKATSILSWNI